MVWLEKYGGVRQGLPISQPQDFPAGKWYADGDPTKWGLPNVNSSWLSLVDVVYYQSKLSNSYIKKITVTDNHGELFTRIIGHDYEDNDSGWQKLGGYNPQ